MSQLPGVSQLPGPYAAPPALLSQPPNASDEQRTTADTGQY